jgi:hypothetical protein
MGSDDGPIGASVLLPSTTVARCLKSVTTDDKATPGIPERASAQLGLQLLP